jgi:copper transport protein
MTSSGRALTGRVVAAVGIALVVVIGPASSAGAHAVLQGSEPAGGQVLAEAPSRVVLRFDEQVEVSFGSIRLYDADGERVEVGSPAHLPSDSRAVAVSLPHFGQGGYVVTWRVVSADSHPVHGAFTFRLGQGSGADTGSLSRRLLAAQGGSAVVGALFAVVRWLAYAAVALLAGGLVLALFAWPRLLVDRRAGLVLTMAAAVALATTVVGIGLQGAYAGGLDLAAASHPAAWRSVLHTRFGKVWSARILLLGAALPLLAILRRGRRHPAVTVTATALAVGLVASFGLAGHPAAGDDVVAAVAADVLHVGAVSIWLSGLVLLAVVTLAPRRDVDRGAVDRFSAIALGCVAVIVATGTFQAWRQVGSVDGLTETTYGRLLLVKLGVFVALVAVAAASRRWLRARSASPGGLAPLRLRVAGEAVLGAAVLAVTALLVNAQPARSALALPYSSELRAEHVLVDVVVDPAKAGPTAVHLYTLTPEGAVEGVQQVTATFDLPAKDIAPIPVPLTQAGPGHFLTTGFDLPLPGRWRLTVKVLVDEFTQDQVVATVSIR